MKLEKLLQTKIVLVIILLLCGIVSANDNNMGEVSISKGDYGLHFVKWYGQASFLVDYGLTVYVDPVNIPAEAKRADVILITHSHQDHLDLESIKKISGGYPQIYGPADVIAKIRDSELKFNAGQLHVIEPFAKVVDTSYEFETVPAYNTTKDAHPQTKGWVGYILTIPTPRGNSRLYFAGDTNFIPEMDNLRDTIDIAFLPLGQKFTMDSVDEAVEAAITLNAEIAVPIHYGQYEGSEQDAQYFVQQLADIEGIEGVILQNFSE